MADKTKIKRSKLAMFLDTSGGEETAAYALIGDGVTEQTIAYNPTTSEEIYIHQDTGTTDVESYRPNIPTPMTAIKGDEVFDYVDGLRRARAIGSAARTKVCIVYLYETETTGAYPAEESVCSIQIDDFGGAGGETATLNFTINLIGDPVQGTFNPATKAFTAAEQGNA
jgi:hypothetical protein|nr:MAG TPA: hypothetical protein [Caudoviricetes sp.]